MFLLLQLQTFISELMPLLTHTSLDPMSPPLSFPVLHSILEDFSTPLLSQCPASLHASLLQIFSVSPRSLKSLTNCLLILFSFFKGAEYKFDNSEVPLFMNTTCSKYFHVSIIASPILFVDSCTCTTCLSVLSHNKARPGCICQSIPFFRLCQSFNTR